MEKPKLLLIESTGQSTVEYVLLLSVIFSLTWILFRSGLLQGLIKESGLYENLRLSMQHAYRHGYPGEEETKMEYRQGNHSSYFFKGKTRFFVTKEYPSK